MLKDRQAKACIANANEVQRGAEALSKAAAARRAVAHMLKHAGRPPLSDTCTICLSEVHMEQPSHAQHRVVVLPDCMHCFHLDCIGQWRLSSLLCPLCQGKLCAVDGMLYARGFLAGPKSKEWHACQDLYLHVHDGS